MPTPDLSQFKGVPNATYQQASTDASVGLTNPDKILQSGAAGGRKAVYARIHVEDNGIRVAFGGTAPTSDIGEVYAANATFELFGWDMISTFRMISDTPASHANCNITVFF